MPETNHDYDIESLAAWLFPNSPKENKFLRRLVHQAMQRAVEFHDTEFVPKDGIIVPVINPDKEDNPESRYIKEILGRFAAKLDEMERNSQPPPDLE